MIQAESAEHLFQMYEIHMGVYLPQKTDTQKRDLKRALSKKYRREYILPGVEEPAEAVVEPAEAVEEPTDAVQQHVFEAVQHLVHAVEQLTAAVEQPAEVQEEPVDNDFDDHPSVSPQHQTMFQLTATPTANDSTSHAPSTNQQICDTTSTVLQPSPCSKTLSASAPSAAISSPSDFPSSSPAKVPPVISSPTSPLDYSFDPTVSSPHPTSLSLIPRRITRQPRNSHQNDEEECNISPLQQQSERTEEESEKTDSQLLLDIDLHKPPSQNYTRIDINEIIRRLLLSSTPTKLSDEIYAICLKKAYHGSAVPAVFLPITYYVLRAQAKQETLESAGLLFNDSHVLLFRFDRFYSQGIRCNCQLNTVAFAEKMFGREIILPIFERGRLISADGKIQKDEVKCFGFFKQFNLFKF
uniref:Uncharacterized protein n=1 Tax=Panagrolaimus davidi TaxID=227884 RepID=A0A914QIH7_9BILA